MATNFESELRNDLSRLSDMMTEMFQNEIVRQDLIDTGLMLRTTRAVVIYTPTGFTFRVESTDYFIFVDARFGITENVLASPQYNDFLNEVAVVYEKYIINEITN